MKITSNVGHGKELTIEQAIENKLTPDAYSYDGQLEKLKVQLELQSEVIAKLMTCLYGKEAYRLSKSQQMEYILGYGYEIEA